MSEKHSALSPASTFSRDAFAEYFRLLCITVGTLVILTGAASAVSLFARAALGSDALFLAFAPVAAVPAAPVITPLTGTTTPIVPATLFIPAIGVHANVEQVGTNAKGNLGTPHTFGDVAWYLLGPKPGDPGNAIIDGHVNNALTTAGVFEHLADLKAGDTIQVSDSTGHTLTYAVTHVEDYSDTNAPLQTIFSNSGPSQLILITCDGQWLNSAHSFNERLVVYASLVRS